jgi:hypothetical protein
MEQMANVNNRYVWTAEEVKLFLALIEEKNITPILDGKQRNSTIYQDLREDVIKRNDKPWNVCSFPLQPLDGNAPNQISFLQTF